MKFLSIISTRWDTRLFHAISPYKKNKDCGKKGRHGYPSYISIRFL